MGRGRGGQRHREVTVFLFISVCPSFSSQVSEGPWRPQAARTALVWVGRSRAGGHGPLTVEAWVCASQVRGVDFKQMLLDRADLQDQENSRYGYAQSRPDDGVLDVCREELNNGYPSGTTLQRPSTAPFTFRVKPKVTRKFHMPIRSSPGAHSSPAPCPHPIPSSWNPSPLSSAVGVIPQWLMAPFSGLA